MDRRGGSIAPRWGGREVTARDWIIALVAAAIWLMVIRPGPLSLPYFWDEADVYVPGSVWVASHGLDVTPGVFPDDYSRGHPPLLYLLAGAAFRLFGPSPAVGHLLVLPFTALALAGTYLLGAMIFGRRAGVAAAALLGATPLFMSIGNMLLPEVPLTALAVLALVLLAQGRLLAAALLGAAAALMKETGVFIAVALAGAVAWDGWRCGTLSRWRETASRLAVASLPVLALCAFFIWQRLSPAGYFIFPHHQDMLFERPLGWRDLLTVWPSLVLWHGRWIVMGAAAIWLARLATRRRVAFEAPDEEGGRRWRPRSSSVIVAAIVLVVVNALFFTKMFWLERYALPAHPGLLVAACGLLVGGLGRRATPDHWRHAPWAAVIATCGLGLIGLRAPTGPNEEEHTFAYADVIATHRLAYQALDQAVGAEPTVLTSWPMTVELRTPYLGYVDRPARTVHVDNLASVDEREIDAVIAPERSRHGEALRRAARRMGLRRVGRYQLGRSQALELYVR